jgi:DNA-binding PadR family transcriptional regulator
MSTSASGAAVLAAVERITPLGLVVLALLREGDMHPYEMMRLLRIRGDERLVSIQNGTFYHTVGRLERGGLLAEVGVDREGNRPERTTYTLTEQGRDVVADWVRRELGRTDRPVEFRVALAEAHNLSRAEVHALLGRRREALAGSLAALESRLAGASDRGIPEQYLVEVDREIAMLRAEISWADRLRARLADGSLPWGAAEVPEHIHARLDALRKAHTS